VQRVHRKALRGLQKDRTYVKAKTKKIVYNCKQFCTTYYDCCGFHVL
jgi:hypothetical protein